jgi:hypothetical protein
VLDCFVLIENGVLSTVVNTCVGLLGHCVSSRIW